MIMFAERERKRGGDGREDEGGEAKAMRIRAKTGSGQIEAIASSPTVLIISLPLLSLSPSAKFFPFNSIMAPVRSSASWLSSLMAVCAILCLSVPANALYFYMDGRQTKCFFEELPKDTLVVGMLLTICSPTLFTTQC